VKEKIKKEKKKEKKTTKYIYFKNTIIAKEKKLLQWKLA
jgi:hypothetical protein